MMRKIIFTLTLLVASSVALAQELLSEPTQDPNAPYRLFNTRTPNILLKLDTRDGRIWQVFWRDRDSNDIEPINTDALVSNGRAGRFTLYPTANTNTFILLDQDRGDAWQVRWGDTLDRFVVLID